MRLAPRLVLAFGFLATASTAGLGFYIRQDRTEAETRRFDDEVKNACTSVKTELVRQAESDRKVVMRVNDNRDFVTESEPYERADGGSRFIIKGVTGELNIAW